MLYDLEPTLEIKRIENLIINFGWELIKQEITDDNITLKIRKVIKPESSPATKGSE